MKITHKQLRQIIKEEVDRADLEALAREVAMAFGMFANNPEAQDIYVDNVVSKLSKEPELFQQFAVAMGKGHKAVREFLEKLETGL